MKIDTSDMVTIQPYFKVKAGEDAGGAGIVAGVCRKDGHEADNIFYDFTINGDEIFCREGYRRRGGGAGAFR